MPRLLLVRHGQSEWNATGRWQGQADSELSDLGRRQAFSAAQRVGVVDLIVASDLLRAATTAEIIAEAIGVGPVVTDPRLRERCAGAYEGLTRAEIEAQFPGNLANRVVPPGWEDDDELAERALAALEQWSTMGDAILVVTHGGLIRTVEERLGADRSPLPNLGARVVDAGPNGFSLGERVELLEPDDVTASDQL